MIKKIKCLRCGFEWIPRTETPKACPRCKSYDWNKQREEIKK